MSGAKVMLDETQLSDSGTFSKGFVVSSALYLTMVIWSNIRVTYSALMDSCIFNHAVGV